MPFFGYCKFGKEWDSIKINCKIGSWLLFLEQDTPHLFQDDLVSKSVMLYLDILTGNVHEMRYLDYLAWKEELTDRLNVLDYVLNKGAKSQ